MRVSKLFSRRIQVGESRRFARRVGMRYSRRGIETILKFLRINPRSPWQPKEFKWITRATRC